MWPVGLQILAIAEGPGFILYKSISSLMNLSYVACFVKMWMYWIYFGSRDVHGSFVPFLVIILPQNASVCIIIVRSIYYCLNKFRFST